MDKCRMTATFASLFLLGDAAPLVATAPDTLHIDTTQAAPAAAQAGSPPQASTPEGLPPPLVNCMTGPFIVFFSSNSADITPDAAEILDYVVGWSCGPGKVQFPISIAGFADRAGQASYNLALSQRRAKAVQTYLSSHGIRAKVVGTLALGEAPVHLRIKTPDGVSERQNRRVEITFRTDIDP